MKAERSRHTSKIEDKTASLWWVTLKTQYTAMNPRIVVKSRKKIFANNKKVVWCLCQHQPESEVFQLSQTLWHWCANKIEIHCFGHCSFNNGFCSFGVMTKDKYPTVEHKTLRINSTINIFENQLFFQLRHCNLLSTVLAVLAVWV